MQQKKLIPLPSFAVFEQTYPLTVFCFLNPKPRKRDSVQYPPEGYNFNNEIQISSLNRLIVFRPAIVERNNYRLGIFRFNPRWCSLVFLFFKNIQMGENLFDHFPLVDKADNLHLASALGTPQRINFPNFLDAFMPYQLRYSLWLVVPDIYIFAVLGSLTLLLYPFPRFLLFSVPSHSI